MDFKLSEDQAAFGDSARALFGDHCGDDALRAHDRSSEPFHQGLWPLCVKTGLHSVLVSEAAGGLGLGMTALMAVLQAQGSALALVPLWEHQLSAAAVERFGTPALAGRVLPEALAGQPMLTMSLAGLHGARGATLRLRRSGDAWRVHGGVGAVPLGGEASHALLAAEVQGDAASSRLVLLPLATARAVPGRSQHHQALADLHFNDVPVPEGAVLAEAALPWFEARAIAALAALQVGVTSAQLARTVSYLAERKQFGRAIGSFQLVAGQMADGCIALEALRSALWQVVYRLDAGLNATPQALALRVLACQCAHRTGHMAQHVHGGMGVDLSYPMHRYLYWSRALATALGGAEAHLERLGDWLAANDELGWKYDLMEPSVP